MTAIDTILPLPDTELEWPDELGGYLSASRLFAFQLCPEKYRRRYLLGEYEPGSGATVVGAGYDAAAQRNYGQKIVSGIDLALDDVRIAAAEGFDTAAGEQEIQWGDDKPGALRDVTVNLAGAYHQIAAPAVQPLAIQERIEIDVPGVPVPIIGYMDVTETARAIELKTAAAKSTVVKPEWRIQGLVYMLAQQKPVDFHLATKTKTPGIYTPDTEPGLRLDVTEARVSGSQRFLATLAENLVLAYNKWGPEEEWPGNLAHTWACDRCSFRPTCSWWAS